MLVAFLFHKQDVQDIKMIEYLKKINKIKIGKVEIQIIPPTIRIKI